VKRKKERRKPKKKERDERKKNLKSRKKKPNFSLKNVKNSVVKLKRLFKKEENQRKLHYSLLMIVSLLRIKSERRKSA